jgi:hypothetical protein
MTIISEKEIKLSILKKLLNFITIRSTGVDMIAAILYLEELPIIKIMIILKKVFILKCIMLF